MMNRTDPVVSFENKKETEMTCSDLFNMVSLFILEEGALLCSISPQLCDADDTSLLCYLRCASLPHPGLPLFFFFFLLLCDHTATQHSDVYLPFPRSLTGLRPPAPPIALSHSAASARLRGLVVAARIRCTAAECTSSIVKLG